MNVNIDFVLLVAVLVLLQLFVLGVDVNKDEKANMETDYKGNDGFDTLAEETLDNNTENSKELSLVVYRSNGEEKIYKRSDVA